MAIEKLNRGLKNNTWTNPQIKNHKRTMNSDCSDHRHNTEFQNIVFKIHNNTNIICGENCKSSWVQVSL